MPKKLRRNRRKARKNAPAHSYLKRFDTNHPERWLDWGATNMYIGASTGAWNAGSVAWNTGLLNTSTADGTSPLQIQTGTGQTSRVGNHIILTRCMIRFYVTVNLGARVRLLILANPRDNLNTSGALTNAQLTAAVEATPFLKAPNKSFNGAGVLAPIDYIFDPASDYTVLYDKMYGTGSHDASFRTQVGTITTGAGVQVGSAIIPIEVDMDLMLPQMYNTVGHPTTGDFIVYMCSTCPNADAGNLALPQAQLFGTIKLQYVDALNLEAIGRSIRDFIDEAGNTLDHMAKSSLFNYAKMAAPYVTKAFGIGL